MGTSSPPTRDTDLVLDLTTRQHTRREIYDIMATVKEHIKESLVGTIIEPSLSTDARATFERKAKKDEETGELYMTEEEFVDAIAPEDEDYVSSSAQERTSPYSSIQR